MFVCQHFGHAFTESDFTIDRTTERKGKVERVPVEVCKSCGVLRLIGEPLEAHRERNRAAEKAHFDKIQAGKAEPVKAEAKDAEAEE